MKKSVQILIIAFIGVVTVSTAKAQTYDPYDVQVINNLIKNNGLQAEPDNPESWPTGGPYPFQIQWTGETPKKIRELDISYCSLRGAVSVAGLTKMTYLNCGDNERMNKLDATNCSSLTMVGMVSNGIFEVNLTGVGHEIYIGGRQKVWLTLYKNNEGKYSLPISLHEPVFFDAFTDILSEVISYRDGVLESSDNTVEWCDFKIKIIGYEYSNAYFEGQIHFTYSDDVGINTQEKVQLKVYSNPTTGELKIEHGELKIENVEILDVMGRSVMSTQPLLREDWVLDISHLPSGVYFLKIKTEQGNIVKEVVKQ